MQEIIIDTYMNMYMCLCFMYLLVLIKDILTVDAYHTFLQFIFCVNIERRKSTCVQQKCQQCNFLSQYGGHVYTIYMYV